jgi:hypothetical protein
VSVLSCQADCAFNRGGTGRPVFSCFIIKFFIGRSVWDLWVFFICGALSAPRLRGSAGPFPPRTWRRVHWLERRQWHVANNVVDFAETVRIGGPRLLAGNVAGADQLAENALQLLAADPQRPADMVKTCLPAMRARYQIAKHAFGLDRQPVIEEDGVRNDGELSAMLAADNPHRGVVSTNTAGPRLSLDLDGQSVTSRSAYDRRVRPRVCRAGAGLKGV